MLNRSRSAQEINKPKTLKTKEAKNFSKSEAELVDVTDTFQHAISIIEKEMAKNFTFLKKDRHTEHELRNGSAHHKQDLNVNSLQQTVSMMMKRTAEQITKVSCGNTAALAGIEQFL